MCNVEKDSRFGPGGIEPCEEVLAAEDRIRAALPSCDNCGRDGAIHFVPYGPGNCIGDGTFCCHCKIPPCEKECLADKISELAGDEVHGELEKEG